MELTRESNQYKKDHLKLIMKVGISQKGDFPDRTKGIKCVTKGGLAKSYNPNFIYISINIQWISTEFLHNIQNDPNF